MTTASGPFLGFVAWEGISPIDGNPVVVVVTGFDGGSGNRKTGGMLQTWILRADVEPHVAVRTGGDRTICGSCPLRGVAGKGRVCYVVPFQAPLSVWRTWKRGRYATVSAKRARGLVAGRRLRIGSQSSVRCRC